MGYTILFTDAADQDFYRILDYIAEDNPLLALKFIDELQERIQNTLSTFPLSGTAYKDGIRYFIFDHYVVIYETIESKKQIAVYMISERHRQWRTILDERIT